MNAELKKGEIAAITGSDHFPQEEYKRYSRQGIYSGKWKAESGFYTDTHDYKKVEVFELLIYFKGNSVR